MHKMVARTASVMHFLGHSSPLLDEMFMYTVLLVVIEIFMRKRKKNLERKKERNKKQRKKERKKKGRKMNKFEIFTFVFLSFCMS